MNKPLLTWIAICFAGCAFSQTLTDKPLQFTGSGADAKVTGIADVSDPSDAVNVDALQRGRLVCATTAGGTADAISLQFTPGITALQLGTMLSFKAASANTGSVTIDVDGAGVLTPVPVKKGVSDPLVANDLKSGQMVSVIFDGTNFQLLAGAGASGGTSPGCITLSTSQAPAGYTFTGYFQDFSTASTSSFWTSRASIPTAKVSPAVTVYNGKIYLFGGNASSSGDRQLCYYYDPVADSWTSIANMTSPRWEAVAELVGSKIYVLGGTVGNACDDAPAREYDPVANTWATKTGTSTLRQMASAVHNNRIYIFGSGGYCCNPCPTNTAVYYTPATDTWTYITGMPINRKGGTARMINSKIYIAGGYTDSGVTARVHEYNPVTDTYSEKAAMPSARQNLTSAVYNGKMYCIGGGVQNEAYDPATNVWEFKTSMPNARSNIAAAEVGGFIYVMAGGSGSSGESVNDRYNPATDTGYRFYMHCQN